MKKSVSIFALAFLLTGSAFADSATPSSTFTESQAQTSHTAPNEGDLESHGHYVNKQGVSVHSPSKSKSGRVPAGASAQCGDGSYSFSRHHSGTCSHHGGVATWY